MNKVEASIKAEYFLSEGPVWDEVHNCLYWVDIFTGNIHKYVSDTAEHSIFNVGQPIGAVALRKSGGLVAAMKDGFYFIDFDSRQTQPITNPEEHLPFNRFNDGKCDAAGRFWAGTMPLSEDNPGGNLYMLDENLQSSLKETGISISNGLAWNSDNTIMYYIDTPTRKIVAYDYDVSTGNISNKRVAIDTTNEQGWPDGMTIDTDGMLWVAFWGGWCVTQYNPHTAEILQKIQLPAAHITCPSFGGETLTDLYVTSARKDLTKDELEKQPFAGSVFVIRNVGTNGLPANRFKG